MTDFITWPQKCRALLQQGCVAEAAALVAQLSVIDAYSVEGCECRAYIANALGDLAGAECALREMIDYLPHINTLLLLASNLHKQQRFSDAQVVLLGILEEAPNLFSAHFNLAQAYLATGDFQAALAPLMTCYQADPTIREVLFQLATVHCQLAQSQQAMPYLEALLALDPHHVEALNNLGVCHIKAENYQAAIHCFATAMRIDEQHLPSRSNLAISLFKEKRYPEALAYFEQYLILAPLDQEALYHAGVVALMLAKHDSALDYFQRVLLQQPTHIASLLNLAAIALKKGEPSNAIGFYQRVLACDAGQPIAVYMLAALTGNTMPDKAPTAYVEALFDQYAPHFDQHLVQGLAYQTPQLLRKLYDRCCKKTSPVAQVVDLGCGTGLSGAAFSDIAVHLTGVDLSEQMLAAARIKNLYQCLLKQDIIDFLKVGEQNFDLMIAADVLVYLGDLSPCLAWMAKRLNQGGICLLSLETAGLKQDFALTTTGRFQHRLATVLAQAKACGLDCLRKEKVALRLQEDKAVVGYVLALQKRR